MNNENNDDFLPGVGPIDPNTPQNIPNLNPNEAPFNPNPTMEPNQFDPNMNTDFDPNANIGFDPNMNAGFDPNANMGFDPNMNAGFDPNANMGFDPNMNTGFDPNANMGFDPNMNAGFDPNANMGFDPNMNAGMDPNSNMGFESNMNASFDPNANMGFDPNMNVGMDPNANMGFDPNMNTGFDSNMNVGMDPNSNMEFDSNINNNFDANIGQAPFEMNQNSNIDPNQFSPDMNAGLDPNTNVGFDPNMNGGFEQNQFDPNMNTGFDQNQFSPNMNNGFEQNQFDPNMNTGFEQNQYTTAMNNNFDPNMNNNGFNPDMNMNEQASASDSADYSAEFERNWMGSIYDKAHSKKFNFCAAFFGPAYLFYRKVYLTGGLTTLIIIIVNIILSLLKLDNILLIFGINAALSLILFFGLGFGFYPIYRDFVRKQFNKYKKQIPDNNQLISVASKKGGASILALIVYYVAMGVVSSVMVYVVFASLVTGLFKQLPQGNITGNNIATNNSISSGESEDQDFVFTEGYSLKYPDSDWVVGTDKKTLVKGAYTLSYTIAYQSTDLGVTDMNSAENRETILGIINASVTNLATSSNLQMDPNDNFVLSNGAYYTYINLSGDTEVTRYYFVLIPSTQRLFQFELKVNDTQVDSETHLEVVKMLTQIKTAVTNATSTPTDGNTVGDNTVDNNTVSNNTVANNTVANNTTSNDVSNNVVSQNNTTANNTTGTSVSNALSNTNS